MMFFSKLFSKKKILVQRKVCEIGVCISIQFIKKKIIEINVWMRKNPDICPSLPTAYQRCLLKYTSQWPRLAKMVAI